MPTVSGAKTQLTASRLGPGALTLARHLAKVPIDRSWR
jgi:hypothetical protein